MELERQVELSLVCCKCHSSRLFAEFVENEVDGDAWFVVCDECGFDREATEDDFQE